MAKKSEQKKVIHGAVDVHTASGAVAQTDGQGNIIQRSVPQEQIIVNRPIAPDTLKGGPPQYKVCPFTDRQCLRDNCELWSSTKPTPMCAFKVMANIMYYGSGQKVHP